MTDPTNYLVTYWDVLLEQMRVVPDEAAGTILLFGAEETALFYASRLAGHGLIARTQPVTPTQVNDVLRFNEVPLDEAAAERVRMLEAQTLDEQDLERWTVEHADRLIARLTREWGLEAEPS